MAANIELLAAKTLLDEGVEIHIPTPFFFRWFGKKYWRKKIVTPYAGTALKILALRLSIAVTDEDLEKLTVDEAFALQLAHGKKVAQMVALGILRERPLIGRTLPSKLLASYLLKVKQFSHLLEYMEMICLGAGVDSFTNSIRLTRMLRLTMPNLSQATQTS